LLLTGEERVPDELLLQRAAWLRGMWVARTELLELEQAIASLRNLILVLIFQNGKVHLSDIPPQPTKTDPTKVLLTLCTKTSEGWLLRGSVENSEAS
jgi:hypothetical protein